MCNDLLQQYTAGKHKLHVIKFWWLLILVLTKALTQWTIMTWAGVSFVLPSGGHCSHYTHYTDWTQNEKCNYITYAVTGMTATRVSGTWFTQCFLLNKMSLVSPVYSRWFICVWGTGWRLYLISSDWVYCTAAASGCLHTHTIHTHTHTQRKKRRAR